MTRAAIFAMAVLTFFSAAALAQPGAAPGAGIGIGVAPTTQSSKPARDLGQYAEMVSVCELSDEQVAKLEQKVAAMRETSSAFWKDNQEKLTKLNKDLIDARAAKDDQKVKQLQDEIKALYDKSRQLFAESQAAILAVLTPQQRITWDSYNLRKSLTTVRYRRITLTPEQEKKLQEFCDEAAKEVGNLKDTTDYAAYNAIQNSVAAKFDPLLTPEQKELLPKALTTLPAKSP
ncbi:MAG: Spy/CpxP family protein refolding chaperone [Phycisphaerae bacterium]